MYRIKYMAPLLILVLLPLAIQAQQEWDVPADQTLSLSPFAFNEANRQAGMDFYQLNCKSCHGDPGKDNYQRLNPLPGDPATSKIQNNSDGSLFYKISEGRGLMPSFKRILSPKQIWEIIAYLRSFNSEYVQSVAVITTLSKLKWSDIRISLELNSDKETITALVRGLEGNKWTPVANAEVSLEAIRYFGKLSVDQPAITNNEGEALFSLKPDLYGDSTGMVNLYAYLTNTDLFGTIAEDTLLKAGKAYDAPSLTSKRAMWNVNSKAPAWLLIAYPAVVLTVWGFIIYVLLLLRKIYYAGINNNKKQ